MASTSLVVGDQEDKPALTPGLRAAYESLNPRTMRVVESPCSRVNQHVEYRLLGQVAVLDEQGRVLRVPRGKATAVLALLALNAGRVVARGVVLDAVWPGEGDAARRSLEVIVSRLRKAIADGTGIVNVIAGGSGGYRLVADPGSVDVTRFERHAGTGRNAVRDGHYDAALQALGAALELWRGPPLEGLEEYPFAVSEAARLEAGRLSVEEAQAEAEIALGQHQRVLARLEELAAAHPERESLHYQLMLAFYRSGRQADALSVYTDVRTHLAQELGIEPNPALKDLQRRVLEQDPSLNGEPPARDAGSVVEVAKASEPAEASLHTFLIADVRGYTRYTHDHGDEAASRLAAWLAEVVRACVGEFNGELVELRGDEALCIFRSARKALRCAVELQRRLRTASQDGRTFPLGVGIGLDAGEAVPTEGGYRGGALNLAARLCATAKPGQTLASEGVMHLARRVEGLQFLSQRPVRLKGMSEPVGFSAVVPDTPLPPLPDDLAASQRRSHSWIAVIAGGMGLAAVVIVAVFTTRSSSPSPPPTRTSAAYLLDAGNGSFSKTLGLGFLDRPTAVAVGDGSVWITDSAEGTLTRIAASGASRQTIHVGSAPMGIAVTPHAVWVANSGDGTVGRVDPTSTQLVDTVRVGNGPVGVLARKHAVWVANSVDGTVVRINPARDQVEGDAIGAGVDPTAIAYAGGRLWVTNESVGQVTAIDLRTRTADDALNVGRGPNAIAAEAGRVWVANTLDGTVTDIDLHPASPTPTTIPVGSSPTALVPTRAGVVATTRSGSVWQLTPQGTRHLLNRIPADPQAAGETGGKLWIPSLPPPTVHRGGTLILATTGDEPWTSLDPDSTDAAFYQSATALEITNDGLVGFKRVGGGGGETLVPDLATEIPTPTDGGDTYLFHVRPGIHYSNGELVRPSDFLRSIERSYEINAPGMGTNYYSHLIGASACVARPQHCDLSKAVIPDDSAGTITFRLTSPDPDFLYQLALAYAYAVPMGTPNHELRRTTVPATGPYQIASFDSKSHEIVLKRNPRFRQWSRDAQPAGYPDRIEWKRFPSPTAILRAIEHGRADWSYIPVSAAQARQLTARYPTRLHPNTWPVVSYTLMNTATQPFSQPDARLALNYAIDRARLQALFGGPRQARITCQIVPMNMYGYAPGCPFTIEPGSGTWTAPDLDKAMRLVDASGTKGETVTLAVDPKATPIDAYLASVLKRLGYHPVFTRNGDHADLSPFGWNGDYPTASNFIAAVCQTGGCDRLRRFHTLIARARAMQLTDPSRAGHLWAAADQALLKDGPPVVSLMTPLSLGFVSSHVGDYQFSPVAGSSPVVDQMWVR